MPFLHSFAMPPTTRARKSLRIKSKTAAYEEVTSSVAITAEDKVVEGNIGAENAHAASTSLTVLQKARIENNRLKALELRKVKKDAEDRKQIVAKRLKQTVAVEVDTGAGFFVDDDDEDGRGKAVDFDYKKFIESEPFAIVGDGNDVECEECCRPFTLSFLRSKFSHNVCDDCHDRDRHKLITRTTAKTKYLLKDADLDKREPVLPFITKRNPRNNHWGEMKLYLESQCHARAMEIWESMDAIEEEATRRKIVSAKSKAKKYDKKMNELKKEVRSSLYTVKLSGHVHEWGAESYNEETDEYTKQCTTCGHSSTYEKM